MDPDDEFYASCKAVVDPSYNFPDEPTKQQLLFAPYVGTRKPLVTEKAFEEDEHYFRKLRSLVPVSVYRKNWLLEYAKDHPKDISVNAIIFCLQDDEKALCNVLSDLRWSESHNLASICERNMYGQTVLMVIIKRRLSPAVLEAVLGIGNRQGKDIIDWQDPSKCTAAHYCARANAVRHMDILVTHLAKQDIKDNRSRTPEDLARSRGYTEILKILGKTVGPSLTENCEDMIFGNLLPMVYLPADEKVTKATSTERIVEYLRRELPVLLGIRPSFVVVPAEFAAECPFDDAESRAGWEAEKKVFEVVREALQQMRNENDKLLIALFHSLRYGCNLRGAEWESDIDLFILCFDTETKAHFGMLVEVKSISSKRDIIRNQPEGKPADGPNNSRRDAMKSERRRAKDAMKSESRQAKDAARPVKEKTPRRKKGNTTKLECEVLCKDHATNECTKREATSERREAQMTRGSMRNKKRTEELRGIENDQEQDALGETWLSGVSNEKDDKNGLSDLSACAFGQWDYGGF